MAENQTISTVESCPLKWPNEGNVSLF